MKLHFLLSFLGIVGCALGVYSQPVKIIYDTDLESDVDDVAATAILHVLADRGEAEILATLVSSSNPWSAPCLDAINTFYGRPDLPIGVPKVQVVNRKSVYAQSVVEAYPHSVTSADSLPDATLLYRQTLANQPDSSVVIVTVGYLTNLSRLLHSSPDTISPLSGSELVRRKVKHYVCMGGRFPKDIDPGVFGNWKPDPAATIDVVAYWPTSILFSGGGPQLANLYQTGGTLPNQVDKENIVRQAYAWFFERAGWAKGPTHHSADLLAVLLAVRGLGDYFEQDCNGYNEIFADGTHEWHTSSDRVSLDQHSNQEQCYVLPKTEDIGAVTNELNQLMTAAPQRRQKP